MKNKILMVEDDLSLGETLKDFFDCNGLSVTWAKDGEAGLKLYNCINPQLVLLDVILPGKNGFEVIAEIRKTNTNIPIIFMTGTQFDVTDQIMAYQFGAINYLKKPVIPQVVLAQINSLINPISIKKYELDFVDIVIDNQLLTINDTQIQLRDKEARLFSFLLENRNKLSSRSEILLSVWGDNSYHLNNSLDTVLSRLKKSLKLFPKIKIISIYGSGYKLTINH